MRTRGVSSLDNIESTIEGVINRPLKGKSRKYSTDDRFRQLNVGKWLIGWEITPSRRAITEQGEIEQVFFLFITHGSEYGNPIDELEEQERVSKFEVLLPYSGEIIVEEEINNLYSLEGQDNGIVITSDPIWEDNDGVVLNGMIPTDDKTILEDELPNVAEVDFDDPEIV